jgi:gliding motility-associated-like protein
MLFDNMKNRLLCPNQSICLFISGRLTIFILSLSLFPSVGLFANGPSSVHRQLNDPFFVDPVPNDTTVNCIDEVPAPVNLTADSDTDPNFPMSIMPVDSLAPEVIDDCMGGTIFRTWTATDMDGSSTSVTQVITVLPDTEPPLVNFAEHHDTVPCSMTNYPLWINTISLGLSTNVSDNCSGIDDISNDAPPAFEGYCGETLTVTFTITDNCGNTAVWQSTYTVVNEGPQLTGVPDDIVDPPLSCENPIPDPPMVTATDYCGNPLDVTFEEVNNQIADGTCTQYEYTIIRTWTATDSCDNVAIATQTITVKDDTAPTFTVPPGVTINCDDDPDDLAITGNVLDAADNCDPDPVIFYTDFIEPGMCPNQYTIIRTWRVRDVCSNLTGKIQTINVVDMEAPTFTPPADTTVSCDQVENLSITGEPSNLEDNCDGPLEVTFSDLVIAGSCENTYTIRRTWRVEDQCGQFTEMDQFINIVDDAPPMFSQQAQDMEIECNPEMDPIAAFTDWVNSRGGAQASDNCSLQDDLIWTAFAAGTSDPPSLSAVICPSPDSVLVSLAVDFIVEDECGNRDTTTAVFSIVDNTPPALSQCPVDITVNTDPGSCDVLFTLELPLIEEACAASFLMENIIENLPITSQADPGNESNVPVDPLVFDLEVSNPLPINAFGDATLVVSLMNADAEQSTEYFDVFGEDGTYLGRTANSAAQCGSSDTTLTVTAAQINSWAADGAITIRLEPNIPANQPGTFAVNAICQPTGTAQLALSFTVKDLSAVDYEYSVNGGARVKVDPIEEVGVTLELGEHLIRYFATDCAGNVDSCSYTVTVQDIEPPALDCPSDIVVNLEPGACTAMVTLPFPDGASDNCSLGTPYQLTLPVDTMQAYLNFSFDPNLNDYLPAEKMFTFTGVAANSFTTAMLTLDLRGDFNTNGAFLQVFGDDDNLLGTTSVGVADCATPGQAAFLIPAATLNAWAADGEIVIRVVPNTIPVPPGVPGDGINACMPPAVNGGIDSVSYIFATLEYRELAISYFGQGVTTIPQSQMAIPAVNSTYEFNLGATAISYLMEDGNGNQDTCTFNVIVEDNEPPTALCQPTTLFINPSGLEIQTIPASELDAGSFDNCAIDTMFLTPNTFDCQLAGTNVNVTLTVIDVGGNTNTCQAIVRIEKEEPMPTANSGLCGGDTLFLFANPPEATGGIIYTYRWFGPPNGGLFSTQQNPVIPSINENNAGAYIVEVTGITGCTSTGTVIVNIEDLPLSPTLLTQAQICTVDDLVLNSSIFPNGNNVTFRWYRGLPPNGTLIGTTAQPSFSLPGPHTVGTTNYYLTVEADGCLSAPSLPVAVSASLKPTAFVTFADTTVCEAETINLGTPVTGPGITYSWTGPNGFSSTAQFPQLGPVSMLSAGLYNLVISRNGCQSDPATVEVSVLPKPATPNIINNGPLCEGQTIVLSSSTIGASTYHWVPIDGPAEIITMTNSYTIPNATVNNTGQWRLYVMRFGCRSNDSPATNVVVNQVPAAAASASPPAVCQGTNLNLFASPGLANASYQWTGPNNFSSVAQNPVIAGVTPQAEGIYQVNITTQQGCSASANVFVDVLQGVNIVDISNNAPDCLNGPTDVELCASVFPLDNGSYQYEWRRLGGIISTQPCAIIPNATEANNGTYTLVVYSGDGCPSQMAQTVLDVTLAPATPPQPVISPSTPAPFCEGEMIQLTVPPYSGNEVTYYWNTPNNGVVSSTNASLIINSATLENAGAYSVFVTVDGCSSGVSAPLNIQVNPTPQITASSNSPVCRGEPLQLSTQFFPGASYFWFGPNDFNSGIQNPSPNTSNPNIVSGVYKVIALVNGCLSDTAFTQVVIENTPARPVASGAASLCISDPSAVLTLSIDSLSATPGALYSWYGPDFTPVSGESSELVFNLTNFENFTADGTYQFYARARLAGCSSAFSEPVSVVLNTIPDMQAFAGDDFSACAGPAVILNAEAPSIGTGRWTLTGGNPTGVVIANPNQPSTSVNGLVGGTTYTFRWALSNGACQNYSFDEVSVMVTEAETANAGTDILACATGEITLNALLPADSTSSGMWSQPAVQAALGVVIVDPSDPTTLVTGLQPDNLYTFTWTITSGCGQVFDEVFVIVSDPEPDAGFDAIACNDIGTAELEAVEPTLGSSGVWSSPDLEIIIDNPTNIRTQVRNLNPGENLFIWTIDESICGEESRDTVIIFYKMNPIAEPDQVIVPFQQQTEFDVLANDFAPPNTTAQIVNGPIRGGTIEYLVEGRFIYTPPFNFVGVDEVTYEICSEGCECSTAKVIFIVGDGALCNAPSIITPNNDGINDAFVVPCLLDRDRFPSSQVLIFNRWGDEVFRSPIPYQNDWAGTFNGEPVPEGTYFFVIQYGDGSEPQSGFLVIQR